MLTTVNRRPTAPVQIHVLAFEGPDAYAQAGGIASRITGLTQTLATSDFETHLWFVGDPDLPGHETRDRLHLHRWCQWLSHHHHHGVYDGEESKRDDYAASLPPFLLHNGLLSHLQRGGRAVILAEEWHTVHAVLHLDWLLRQAGYRQRVTIFWNANNTFGFDRIDWGRLAQAATITTVSRYMKHVMKSLGAEALVIPNGLGADSFIPPEPGALSAFHRCLRARTVITKMARWDPDKRWVLAIHTVASMKAQGWRPLLLARGGIEAHGAEVWATAAAAGLWMVERTAPQAGIQGLLHTLQELGGVDIVSLRSTVDPESRRVLFHGSAAVLANSSHEPFGLVGLETMAVGGVACTGSSGEDYAMPGENALVLETNDPQEFIDLFGALRIDQTRERALRHNAVLTAKRYVWQQIVRHALLPRLHLTAHASGPVNDGEHDEHAAKTAVLSLAPGERRYA
jgi:glycosyltransferase involved in cell wall biosynthesis